MNERIEKLARQACINAGYDTEDELFDALFELGAEFHEKFAELIVRECANAIITDSRLNDVRSAANGCVRTIKEHFGVEE